jgi:hypothetical protein
MVYHKPISMMIDAEKSPDFICRSKKSEKPKNPLSRVRERSSGFRHFLKQIGTKLINYFAFAVI